MPECGFDRPLATLRQLRCVLDWVATARFGVLKIDLITYVFPRHVRLALPTADRSLYADRINLTDYGYFSLP